MENYNGKERNVFNDLFFLAEKENSLEISKAGFYRIFPNHERIENEMKKETSLDFSKDAVIKISKEKFDELSAKFSSLRQKFFALVKDFYELREESDSLIPNTSLEQIFEPCTVLYGVSKNYRNFRYVTKAVEEAEAEEKAVKFCIKHLVPMDSFINKDFSFDEFDKLMKAKFVVCKITDNEKENFSNKKIVVLDKYTGKEINF